MKNSYIFILTGLLAPVLFSGCASPPSSGAEEYKTIPLNEYKYEPAAITSGTEINILAFSGGKDIKGSMYYSQFIGTEKSTGDTIRILAAFISVPSENGGEPTLSPASMFDGHKGVREAVYLIPNKDQIFMMKMAANLGMDVDTAKIRETMADTAIPQKEYVILQDEVPLFKGNYKTAVGIMYFRQQPF